MYLWEKSKEGLFKDYFIIFFIIFNFPVKTSSQIPWI